MSIYDNGNNAFKKTIHHHGISSENDVELALNYLSLEEKKQLLITAIKNYSVLVNSNYLSSENSVAENLIGLITDALGDDKEDILNDAEVVRITMLSCDTKLIKCLIEDHDMNPLIEFGLQQDKEGKIDYSKYWSPASMHSALSKHQNFNAMYEEYCDSVKDAMEELAYLNNKLMLEDDNTEYKYMDTDTHTKEVLKNTVAKQRMYNAHRKLGPIMRYQLVDKQLMAEEDNKERAIVFVKYCLGSIATPGSEVANGDIIALSQIYIICKALRGSGVNIEEHLKEKGATLVNMLILKQASLSAQGGVGNADLIKLCIENIGCKINKSEALILSAITGNAAIIDYLLERTPLTHKELYQSSSQQAIKNVIPMDSVESDYDSLTLMQFLSDESMIAKFMENLCAQSSIPFDKEGFRKNIQSVKLSVQNFAFNNVTRLLTSGNEIKPENLVSLVKDIMGTCEFSQKQKDQLLLLAINTNKIQFQEGDISLIKYLVEEQNCNVNERFMVCYNADNPNEMICADTPLMSAMLSCNSAIVSYLINGGAELEQETRLLSVPNLLQGDDVPPVAIFVPEGKNGITFEEYYTKKETSLNVLRERYPNAKQALSKEAFAEEANTIRQVIEVHLEQLVKENNVSETGVATCAQDTKYQFYTHRVRKVYNVNPDTGEIDSIEVDSTEITIKEPLKPVSDLHATVDSSASKEDSAPNVQLGSSDQTKMQDVENSSVTSEASQHDTQEERDMN